MTYVPPEPRMIITMHGVKIYQGNVVPITVEIDGMDHIIRRDDDLLTDLGLPGLPVNPKEF